MSSKDTKKDKFVKRLKGIEKYEAEIRRLTARESIIVSTLNDVVGIAVDSMNEVGARLPRSYLPGPGNSYDNLPVINPHEKLGELRERIDKMYLDLDLLEARNDPGI